jgi:hypothetical protein
MEVCMSDVEVIKKIAEEYEMPIEQVALLFSFLGYVDEYVCYRYGIETPYADVVRAFIEAKMV